MPVPELYRRLEERNVSAVEAFTIPRSEMDRYLPAFQPPTADELDGS
ncbi:MAG: hypothetical protein FWD83_10875 [Promicromonosporaceae bacterium]|nr:hypothetical protein [Promicromonosporaceae bacterium]